MWCNAWPHWTLRHQLQVTCRVCLLQMVEKKRRACVSEFGQKGRKSETFICWESSCLLISTSQVSYCKVLTPPPKFHHLVPWQLLTKPDPIPIDGVIPWHSQAQCIGHESQAGAGLQFRLPCSSESSGGMPKHGMAAAQFGKWAEPWERIWEDAPAVCVLYRLVQVRQKDNLA